MKYTARTQLWVLRKKGPVEYDHADSFVVRAASPAAARRLAADADSGARDVWLYAKNSTAKVLKPEGTEGIVIGSFNNG